MCDAFLSTSTDSDTFMSDTSCVRFLDKNRNAGERGLYSDYWQEQLCMFGQRVTYYVSNYNTDLHDGLYGEAPDAGYHTGVEIVMAVDLTENNSILGRYGLQSDDDVTWMIHISSFYSAMSAASALYPEPKSGDVFELTEYGEDRPGGRRGKKFEITDRSDQDNSQINQLMGHYVWTGHAKRYDYSYEPGLTAETVNDQVYDSNFAGRLSGGTNDPSANKSYTFNVDVSAASDFDYDSNGNNDSVYGDYV